MKQCEGGSIAPIFGPYVYLKLSSFVSSLKWRLRSFHRKARGPKFIWTQQNSQSQYSHSLLAQQNKFKSVEEDRLIAAQ